MVYTSTTNLVGIYQCRAKATVNLSACSLLQIHDSLTLGGLTTHKGVLKYREIPAKIDPALFVEGLRTYDFKVTLSPSKR